MYVFRAEKLDVIDLFIGYLVPMRKYWMIMRNKGGALVLTSLRRYSETAHEIGSNQQGDLC